MNTERCFLSITFVSPFSLPSTPPPAGTRCTRRTESLSFPLSSPSSQLPTTSMCTGTRVRRRHCTHHHPSHTHTHTTTTVLSPSDFQTAYIVHIADRNRWGRGGGGAGVKEGPQVQYNQTFRPVHILEQNILINGINYPVLVLKYGHSKQLVYSSQNVDKFTSLCLQCMPFLPTKLVGHFYVRKHPWQW